MDTAQGSTSGCVQMEYVKNVPFQLANCLCISGGTSPPPLWVLTTTVSQDLMLLHGGMLSILMTHCGMVKVVMDLNIKPPGVLQSTDDLEFCI